jgi:hypothetical protein
MQKSFAFNSDNLRLNRRAIASPIVLRFKCKSFPLKGFERGKAICIALRLRCKNQGPLYDLNAKSALQMRRSTIPGTLDPGSEASRVVATYLACSLSASVAIPLASGLSIVSDARTKRIISCGCEGVTSSDPGPKTRAFCFDFITGC